MTVPADIEGESLFVDVKVTLACDKVLRLGRGGDLYWHWTCGFCDANGHDRAGLEKHVADHFEAVPDQGGL